MAGRLSALLITLGFPVVLGLAGGCGGGAGTGDGATVLFNLPEPGGSFQMHDVPWPNDVLLGEDGHPDYQIQYGTPPSNAALMTNLDASQRELGGWGVTTGVFFWTAAEVDPASLTADTAFIVDLVSGELVPSVTHVRVDPPAVVLMPAPGAVLREKRSYGFVLTPSVFTTGGQRLARSRDLEKILGTAGAEGDANLAKAFLAYTPFRSWMASHQKTSLDVAGVSVVTTKPVRRDLITIHDRIAASTTLGFHVRSVVSGADLDDLFGTPPDATPGFSGSGVTHDAILSVVHGTFTSPSYLAAQQGVTGIFRRASDGTPMPYADAELPFLLALPKLTGDYSNLPVAIVQHGLGGSRGSALLLANELCRAGVAVIAFDLPLHGDRSGAATDLTHAMRGTTGTDGVFVPAPGPDGLPETSAVAVALKFADVMGDGAVSYDPRAIRAVFLQASVDQMALAHTLMSGSLAELRSQTALPALSFQGDRIVLAGVSMGSLVGLVTLGAEPHLTAGYFSVGGGGIVFPLLVDSPTVAPTLLPYFDGAASLSAGEVDPRTDPAQFHPIYQLLQAGLDDADPLAWAPYLRSNPTGPNKHIVVQESLDDEVVNNLSTESLAGALGLPLIGQSESPTAAPRYFSFGAPVPAPVSANAMGATRGLVIYREASHEIAFNQHGKHTVQPGLPPFSKLAAPVPLNNPIAKLQHQLAAFAHSYVTTGTPTIIDP